MENNIEPCKRLENQSNKKKVKTGGLSFLLFIVVVLIAVSAGYSQHIDAANYSNNPVKLFRPNITFIEKVLSSTIKLNYAGSVNFQGRNFLFGNVFTSGFEDVKDVVFRRTVDIANRTEQVPDTNLEKGTMKVVAEGYNGQTLQTVIQRKEGSKVISEEILYEVVIKEPQNQLVAVGTRDPVRSLSTSRGDVRYTKMMVMKATAYEPSEVSCGIYASGYTAIGMVATKGVVAVDPKVIPLRTKLYIEGYGFAVAGDVGGSIKGNRIDLCYDTVRECLNFGRRDVKVYILE